MRFVLTVALLVNVVMVGCIGDQGLQVRVVNATGEQVTAYEEPRDARSEVVLEPAQEAWMILCRKPGVGPCNATIRAIDRSGGEVFCQRYGQDELSRTGRIELTLGRKCG